MKTFESLFTDEVEVDDKRVIELALKCALEIIIPDYTWMLEHADSPIEQLMGIALVHAFRDSEATMIQPQVGLAVGKKEYRMDFLIDRIDCFDERHFPIETSIAVECDGHAFHEKTKEQAARDKSRDRAIQSKGIYVMRFTGSEINKDPMKCALEVRAAMDNMPPRKS